MTSQVTTVFNFQSIHPNVLLSRQSSSTSKIQCENRNGAEIKISPFPIGKNLAQFISIIGIFIFLINFTKAGVPALKILPYFLTYHDIQTMTRNEMS